MDTHIRYNDFLMHNHIHLFSIRLFSPSTPISRHKLKILVIPTSLVCFVTKIVLRYLMKIAKYLTAQNKKMYRYVNCKAEVFLYSSRV